MTSTLLAPQTYHKIVKKRLNVCDNDSVDFKVEQISEQYADCTDQLVLKIRVKSEKEIKNLSFFVKLFPKTLAKVNYVQQTKSFEKEIFAYTVYFKNVKKYLPQVDLSFISRHFYSKPNEVIVLENLTDEGYSIAKTSYYFDEAHVKVALKTLAEFHAVSLAYEETKSKEIGEKYRLTDEFANELEETSYKKDENLLTYQYLRAAHEDILYLVEALPQTKLGKEDVKNKLSEKFEEIFEVICDNGSNKNVFSHGNLQFKNVMFKYKNNEPVSCKFINFGSIKYCPPAFDVLQLLLHVTNSEMRKSSLDDYLNFYYQCLEQQLTKYDLHIANILPKCEYEITCDNLLPIVKLVQAYKVLAKLINQNIKPDDSEAREKKLFNLVCSNSNVMNQVEVLLDVISNDVIRREDCFKILKRKLGHTHYELIDYELVPFDEKRGYLGEHYHLNVQIKENGKVQNIKFFVKTLPKTQSQKDFTKESDTAFKENRMFTALMPLVKKHGINLLDKNFPAAYLCTQDGTIVLDDLGEEGYKQLDKTNSLDYNTTKLMVQALARFHASFLILEEKITEATGRKYRLIDEFKAEFKEVFFAENDMANDACKSSVTGLRASVETFYDDSGPLKREKFLELGSHAIRNQRNVVVPSKKYRNTICHGDAWVNNMLFKYNEDGEATNCIIVDFQSYRYCVPARDILGTIHFTTDRSFREKHLKEMLEIYYSEMCECFKKHDVDINTVLPYDQFVESCEYYKESVLVQTITHYQIIMMGKQNIDELFSDPDTLFVTFFKDKYDFMLAAFQNDLPYKRRNYDCFLDLKNYYESKYV